MGFDGKRRRVVVATRKTPLTLLLERHGTHLQARFYLKSRGQDLAEYERAHQRFEAGLQSVLQAIPPDQRRVRVDRADLDRFLFAPDDVVAVVGQDGLVPNVAKYLSGQTVLGINPDPERYDGVLCQHPPGAMSQLLAWLETGEGKFRLQRRIMALALREDGQRLLALNEVFIGHRTHQSARYRLRLGSRNERHSSSGIICATGTGSTGWARSIARQRSIEDLPGPEDPRLAWFVREPFPSVATSTSMDFGYLKGEEKLIVHSEMGEDGVIFADGIEADRLEFLSGHQIEVGLSPQTLNLLVPLEAPVVRTPRKKQKKKQRRKKSRKSQSKIRSQDTTVGGLTGTTASSTEVVVDPSTGRLVPVDPNTGRLVPVDPKTGFALEVDPKTGLLMQADPSTGRLTQLDPRTVRQLGLSPRLPSSPSRRSWLARLLGW